MSLSQRYLSLWLPHLPTERILRRRLGLSWRSRPPREQQTPLVISRREANAQRIVALDEKAAALSLKPGMGIADARAMHPAIEIVEADPEADRRLLESVADWCDRYTPLVALDGEGLLLDVTGCAHLFGGEQFLLDDMLSRLFHMGFDARGGLASTPGAAFAAARYLSPLIVPQGGEADLVAPLPLAALRLDPDVRAGLESVGLRTAGAILAAPRAPLARRFGRGLLLRIDQALGRVEEAISPRLPLPELSVERALAEPIGQMEGIEAVLLLLAGTMKGDLERRGEGARRLELMLFRVDGMTSRIRVGASRPLRDPATIGRLFHEKLTALEGDIDMGCGFDLIRLSAMAVSRLDPAQIDLDGASGQADGEAALFADRVRARLGDRSVLKAALTQSHLPEHAAVDLPFHEVRPPVRDTPRHVPGPVERPIRLLAHPECVEVTAAEVPEGPPAHFHWRRAAYRVARAEGPERIAPEWWRQPADAAPRDYFRVEDEEGRRYWLFRQGFYGSGATPRWFMHGLFA